ncbi:MAG: Crp/Fnr family transcriptional regulator [Ferruginibacter sp.]|uniref:ThuA domain-containing protein n=1 Tax=Ferruginibacter sp. TaxID=1940288 RepID=UPI00265869BE|nr:ThuA domain-containing protein [Ferruginibacter sp.]MDB5275862.1 Crp/Fnr family transcriptional regulator [Ferruginibacter sp.]
MTPAIKIARNLFLLCCCIAAVSFTFKNTITAKAEKDKILVFSKTNGYRHESIETGIEAIKKLGAANNFDVDATEDSTYLNDANFKKYKAVVFLCTTGTVLGKPEEQALQNYIHNGGGFVGVHAATDCEYDFAWYDKMIGANFLSHPRQQEAKLIVVDNTHASTKHLPATWVRKDEWYNFKNMNPDVKVLIKIDETSYEGGKNGDNHPMAWYQQFEGGRVFYTELGHTIESYSEQNYLQHLLGGIKYAMGKK